MIVWSWLWLGWTSVSSSNRLLSWLSGDWLSGRSRWLLLWMGLRHDGGIDFFFDILPAP